MGGTLDLFINECIGGLYKHPLLSISLVTYSKQLWWLVVSK